MNRRGRCVLDVSLSWIAGRYRGGSFLQSGHSNRGHGPGAFRPSLDGFAASTVPPAGPGRAGPLLLGRNFCARSAVPTQGGREEGQEKEIPAWGEVTSDSALPAVLRRRCFPAAGGGCRRRKAGAGIAAIVWVRTTSCGDFLSRSGSERNVVWLARRHALHRRWIHGSELPGPELAVDRSAILSLSHGAGRMRIPVPASEPGDTWPLAVIENFMKVDQRRIQ